MKNRLDSLIPVLQSTEKLVRLEYLPTLNDTKTADINLNVMKILPELEESSLKLWNIVNFKQKECDEEENYGNNNPGVWKAEFKKLTKLKYFTALLLSLMSLLDLKNTRSKIRSLKCMLKAYYDSIDNSNLDVSEIIKEYCERLITYFETFHFDNNDEEVFQNLKLEFFILDLQSSLLSNNISLAKFYESKANIVENCVKMKLENVFNICRTFYNDGLKLYKENNYLDSHYFLEKCYLILEKMDTPEESFAENKIRSSTLVMLAKCCIKINNNNSLQEANKLLRLLQNNERNRIDAFKLQLELIDYQDFTNNEIESQIMKIIITFKSNVEILKEVLIILNSYSQKNPTIAKNCLLYVFTNKINYSDKSFMEISESYLISLIWMVTSQLKREITSEKINIARSILEIGDKKLPFELSKETSNCLTIMLWSMGKKKMKEGNFTEALEWFECCFIRFLKNVNGIQQEETIGKIQRSMLQCCLELNNRIKFENIINELNDDNKNNPLTLYYRFTCLLKFNNKFDNNEIQKILDNLSNSNDSKTLNLLALCVVESKSYIDRTKKEENEIIYEPLNHAINKLLDKCFISNKVENSNLLPVALRCSVYIYSKTLDNDIKNKENKENSIKNVNLIEKSVDYFIKYASESFEKSNQDELLKDIEWFSSNCYNCGLMLLEKNILDVKSVKLFHNVTKLIEFCKTKFDKMISFKYFKWECKSVMFKCICEKEIIKEMQDRIDQSLKWREIYENIHSLSESIKNEKDEEFQEMKFQCVLLKNESLICRKDWALLIQGIKGKNEYSKEYTDDNQELDILIENLLDFLKNKEIEEQDQDYLIQICDVILIERGFKKQFQIDIKMLFKWIYLLINQMINKTFFEDKLLDYINIFKDILKLTIEKEQKTEIKDSEIEWLSGICWNKGIEILLQEKQGQTDSDKKLTEDEDTSMEESFDQEEQIKNNQSSHNNKIKWCEVAIAASKLSSESFQYKNMEKLYAKLGSI